MCNDCGYMSFPAALMEMTLHKEEFLWEKNLKKTQNLLIFALVSDLFLWF